MADFFVDIVTEGKEIIPAANKKRHLKPGHIYFCTEGSLSILVPDGGLSTGNSIECISVGLVERYRPLVRFKCTGSGPVTLRKTTYVAFDRLLIGNHPQCVEALAKMLVFMNIFTIDLHNERRQVASYQTIRPMLYHYFHRQRTHEGENEGLMLFVIRRTNLSRTHVSRVLADLEAGGYITMKQGKLIFIDHPLPADY